MAPPSKKQKDDQKKTSKDSKGGGSKGSRGKKDNSIKTAKILAPDNTKKEAQNTAQSDTTKRTSIPGESGGSGGLKPPKGIEQKESREDVKIKRPSHLSDTTSNFGSALLKSLRQECQKDCNLVFSPIGLVFALGALSSADQKSVNEICRICFGSLPGAREIGPSMNRLLRRLNSCRTCKMDMVSQIYHQLGFPVDKEFYEKMQAQFRCQGLSTVDFRSKASAARKDILTNWSKLREALIEEMLDVSRDGKRSELHGVWKRIKKRQDKRRRKKNSSEGGSVKGGTLSRSIAENVGYCDEESRLALTFSTIFMGSWSRRFGKSSTMSDTFLAGNNTSKKMRFLLGSGDIPFTHSDEYACSIIGLPCQRLHVEVYLLLPAEASMSALAKLTSKLLEAESNANLLTNKPLSAQALKAPNRLLKLISTCKTEKVDFKIPRVTVKGESYLMNEPLRNLGLRNVLDIANADLRPLIAKRLRSIPDASMRLYASHIVQNVSVSLDENGIDIAALTIVDVSINTLSKEYETIQFPILKDHDKDAVTSRTSGSITRSVPQVDRASASGHKTFQATHPFLMAIVHVDTQVLMFVGEYTAV